MEESRPKSASGKHHPNKSKDPLNDQQNSSEAELSRHKFLKVAPSLFTPEKLPLFDSLDLYTALIRSSKALEQGERLHNLSWRIMNKALLKDHELNKSKKRDGVRNLYQVLNPANTGQFQRQQQPRQTPTPPRAQLRTTSETQPMQVMSAMQGTVSEVKTSPEQPRFPHINHQKLPTRATSDLQIKRGLHRAQDPRVGYQSQQPHLQQLHIQHVHAKPAPNKQSARFTLGNDSSVSSPESSQMMLASSDATVFAGKREGSSQASSVDVNDAQKRKKNHKRPAQPTRSAGSLFTSRPDDGAMASALPTKAISHDHMTKSLFGRKPAAHHKPAAPSSENKVFFSSDDDESDWNSLSDDSELYDDEEDDQYYQRQWDKLMFSRSEQGMGGSHAGRNTTPPPADKQDPKRSLLSGLFLNELTNKNPTPPIMTPLTAQHPTLEESSVVAVGDVTPASLRASTSSFFPEETKEKVPEQTAPSAIPPRYPRSRGSFSSIISDSTLQRYSHQSNAPPTAQTILPTALSTHMFLPNNVHQQRMARSFLSRSALGERRESMDIPSKNRNNSFLKTRMEISEEEEFSRAKTGTGR
ncbi:LAQU0S11e00144g1_1 [Lachancea quebecensis]|uniref:LAQU0S11e00144g1_1 n=1 Tax=Lachancea quebecensis TaxID=1654605 RepID=A0A0P1KWF6_9SACH|nr:LAQU0S11e00144g1_1 [Lachancea quebecensis]